MNPIGLMPYYHVIASDDSTGSKYRGLFSDLCLTDLKAKFVRPYLLGQHVLAGNDQVDVYRITKLLIIKTDAPSSVVRSRLQEESFKRIERLNAQGAGFIISVGSGYHPEDIKDGGVDVTGEFINGSVGSKKEIPWYGKLFLTVAGGLLIAAIVWFVGWK